jgi:hypothetical protein
VKASHGPWALGLALLPGAMFGGLLAIASVHDARFSFVREPSRVPWPVLVIAGAGAVGVIGAVLDHRYHRGQGGPLVGPLEHRSHVVALLSALPLFVVMATATWMRSPGGLLVPAFALAMHVLGWVAHDAFVFHRRRRTDAREKTFHAMTTLGHGAAFLAWVHWIWGMGR